MSTLSRYFATLLPIVVMGVGPFILVNCRSADDNIFNDQLTTAGEQQVQSPLPKASTTPTSGEIDDTKSTGVVNGFGDGSDDSRSQSSEDITYPTLSFTGRGNLDHRNGTATVMQKLSASMDKSKLTVTVQQFIAEGGDNKDAVNEAISAQIGDTVFNRVPTATSVSRLTADTGSFLIFSRSFEDRRSGKSRAFTVTSGDALPVLVIPAAESRYEALSTAALQFQSQLSSNGQVFSVKSTITGRKIATGLYQVTIEYYIPEDRFGELYGTLPLSKTTDYGIDLNAKRISSIDSRGQYNDIDNNIARAFKIAYQLCQSTRDGKIETINSCQ